MVAQPRVILATTSLDIATSLEGQLTGRCRELGLALEIGPQSGQKFFDSSDHLFTDLSARDPADLLDTLIILHLSLELEECFESKVLRGSSGWHVSNTSKPGVAMELVLRFPQLFPVFLSPLVPPRESTPGGAEWNEFNEWIDGWVDDLPKHTEEGAAQPARSSWERIHFTGVADRLQGLGLTLQRFANGYRSIFDPTGLRSLLRNRFLGQVFGSLNTETNDGTGWENTKDARRQLGRRFERLAVILEEEPDLTLLSGYAAYKFGYRSWMISSYSEFANDELPDWGRAEGLLLVRDIDLRLPDIPARANSEHSMRSELSDIYSEQWAGRLNRDGDYTVRVLSQHTGVIAAAELTPPKRHADTCHIMARLRADAGGNGTTTEAANAVFTDDDVNEFALKSGQTCECSGEVKFIGLTKPLGSIYAITKILPGGADRIASLIGGLPKAEEMKRQASHGAPYMNLRIATHLIQQARPCRESREFRPLIVAALLAQEAYSLLLGMSQSTALAALREMHLAEATVESSSTGIRYSVSIKERQDDLSLSVHNICPPDAGLNFLAKLWADLRLVYKEGEQFEASEKANIESLVNARWFPSLSRRTARGPFLQLMQRVKKAALQPLYSFSYLLAFWVVWAFVLTVLYCNSQSRWGLSLSWAGLLNFSDVYLRMIVAITRAEQISTEGLEGVGSDGPLYVLYRLTDLLCAITSVLAIGLVVSVIFRKSTRG